MLGVLDRSSQTLTLPSLPEDIRDLAVIFATLSTAIKDVVAVSCPERVCIPCKVVLSKISMVLEGAEADAA